MNIGEAIQRIQSLYSAGVQSRSSRLTPPHIYSKLKTARSFIYGRMLSKRNSLPSIARRYISCFELERVAANDCNIGLSIPCDILKSKCKLPASILNQSEMKYDFYVSDNTLKPEKINLISETAIEFNDDTDYKIEGITGYIQDEFLYILDNINLEYISFYFYPADIIDAQTSYICPDEVDSCINFNELSFMTDDKTAESVFELAKIELVQEFGQIKNDYRNDSKDKRT